VLSHLGTSGAGRVGRKESPSGDRDDEFFHSILAQKKFTGKDFTLSHVHDALSFYYENRDELDQKAEQGREFVARLKKKIPSKLS
jgi:hypothetical protein